MEAFIARQPIFNNKLSLYGYELLFRNSMENFMPDVDGDFATSHVISNSYIDTSIEQIAGDGKAFINFTERLLKERIPLLLPSKSLVIEILENIIPDDEIVEACKELKRHGYKIALDDFEYTPAYEPLIEMADIIKFDFLFSSLDYIKKYKQGISDKTKLLAEKIEDQQTFDIAAAMGFKLFQGYFFSKPQIIKRKSIPSSKLSILKIMVATNKPDFDFHEIESYITGDLGISYKLLRYINTAHFAPKKKIDSVKNALVYMGAKEIRRFINLISILQLNSGRTEELLTLSCLRAKMCELLGKACRASLQQDELFTLGIFSLVDVILEMSMREIMAKLPLCNSIKDALTDHQGPIYPFLHLVTSYEHGQWDDVDRLAESLKIDPTILPLIYEESCAWSNNLLKL